MKILVIADIHNDTENLLSLLDRAEEISPYNLIVAIGDFTDVNLPKGFTTKDIGKIILEILKSKNVPVLATPGNFDRDLIELFRDEGVLIHGNGKIMEKIGFYGYGGAKTPFNTPLEPSEDEIYQGLKKGWLEVENAEIKIQITHVPPFQTKLDLISSGLHVGSESVRKFIEEKQPHVAVCAHIHESRGIDRIGNTQIINPGRFPEGYAGFVEIDEKTRNVKIRMLELI